MNLSTPELRDLAIRLLADEAGGELPCCSPAVHFCAQLGTVFSKLTGPAGSRSLLARALVLSREEAPCLSAVQVMPDGQLQGFEESSPEDEQDEWNKAGIVLVAQLLGLLYAFIGEQLTLQLVAEAWPSSPPNRQVDRNSQL